MHARVAILLTAATLTLAPAAGRAAMSDYTQNFETMSKSSTTALSADGWLAYGNVFSPTKVYIYGYGPFPAPNASAPGVPIAFSALDTLQGDVQQGTLQLSVYSDYNNTAAHNAGNWVESNVYHEQIVTAADVGSYYIFQFDAKRGNWSAAQYGPSALAFIKTLNPTAGWALTNFITCDMTTAPENWHTYRLLINIDASLVGQYIQFGFANTATHFDPTGVFYDNVTWTKAVNGAGVEPSRVDGFAMRPATPNPFRVSTRMDFSLAARGAVTVAVYDVGGRRVATLFDGVAEPGLHPLSWDGRRADGSPAPSGVYQCVLKTPGGVRASKVVLSR